MKKNSGNIINKLSRNYKNKNPVKEKNINLIKIRRTIKHVALTGIVLSVIGTSYVYCKCKDDISFYIKRGYEKVENIDKSTFNSRHPSRLLDKNGNVLKEFKTVEYDYQDYDEINKKVFKAVVAIEDVRFYEHNGIDIKGLMRAFYSTVVKGQTQGGSTITQQLSKNIFLTFDKTIWRKLEEAVIAQELEKKYSKEEILEFYVNNINYANGCYSIESASKYYFNKETEELNLAEIALLVGIPNNPTVYNPVTHIDRALNRKNIVLKRMFNAGYISEEELNKELKRKIELDIRKVNFDNSLDNNYALNYAVQKATENLMRCDGFQFKYSFSNDKERIKYFELYNESYAESRQELVNGGYKIETSIDMKLQSKLQSIIDNKFKSYTKKQKNGLYMKQASATMIDNKTGNVVAIVGGRSQENKKNTYNRAALGARQPGSTIKPLVDYTPAFENGYIPENKMEDRKINNGPKNWYGGYKGFVSLRYATEISINTVAYRLANEVGLENACQYLSNMNFKYITSNDKESSVISIGGFERGATTTEMASGYSTLAKNGEFIEPTNIERMTKIGNNEVIYENKHSKKRIYDAGASYLMTDVLKGVNSKAYGTGYRYRLRNYKYQAGKSGTTNNGNDYWFCGYTPLYSMSVWAGDDIPSAQDASVGYATGYIWRDMMEYIHKGKEVKDFEKPKSVYKDRYGALRAEISNDNDLIKKRRESEETRKKQELVEQKNRLNDLAYRIVYGLSLEEEEERELKAQNSLNILEMYNFSDLSQLNEVNQLLLETYNTIKDVKRNSIYDNYINQYKLYKNKMESIKYDLIERKRIEQERLKQERLEQQRIEQERLKQKLEEERIERERLEKEKLEQEEQVNSAELKEEEDVQEESILN